MLFTGANMIKTTAQLLEQFKEYANPANKISYMVKKGELFPVTHGVYETEKSTLGYLLAGSIYGPSYLSFDFALSYYGLIPEAAYAFTSATFGKRKQKIYKTTFGTFLYRDVPKEAYPFEIRIQKEGEYFYLIASPEKALCDKLYTLSPLANMADLKQLLFEDLRIDEQEFDKLNRGTLIELAEKYRCTNLKLLAKLLRRKI